MRIRYRITPCQLGRLLIAATDRGVCFVGLADLDAALKDALSSEYPSAGLQNEDSGLGEWAGLFLSYLSGKQTEIDLPVDVRGTDFQRRVWAELQAIPYGSTRTYGRIARSLGYPTAAARAVGKACATNPVSLVIPCHRAVREDGGLAGYRWGIDRKQHLIAQERARLRGQPLALSNFPLFGEMI